jgi:hypothetical protein
MKTKKSVKVFMYIPCHVGKYYFRTFLFQLHTHTSSHICELCPDGKMSFLLSSWSKVFESLF